MHWLLNNIIMMSSTPRCSSCGSTQAKWYYSHTRGSQSHCQHSLASLRLWLQLTFHASGSYLCCLPGELSSLSPFGELLCISKSQLKCHLLCEDFPTHRLLVSLWHSVQNLDLRKWKGFPSRKCFSICPATSRGRWSMCFLYGDQIWSPERKTAIGCQFLDQCSTKGSPRGHTVS